MKKILFILFALMVQTAVAQNFNKASYDIKMTGVAYSDDTAENIRIAGEDFDKAVNQMLKEMHPVKITGCSALIQENELGLSVTYKATLVKCSPEEAVDTLIRVGYIANGANEKLNVKIARREREKKSEKEVAKLSDFKRIVIETIEKDFETKYWSEEFIYMSEDFIMASRE